MKNINLLNTVCACILSLLFTNIVFAAIVNVDYGGLTPAYSGQGALGAGGTTWTRVAVPVSSPITSMNLADSNGIATGIDASLVARQFSSINTNRGNLLTVDAARLSLISPSAGSLSLSGLNPLSTYNLILYGVAYSIISNGSAIFEGTTFTVDGVSRVTDGDLGALVPGGFGEGHTHVTFTGLTADINNKIQAVITGNNSSGVGYINGFQLEEILAVPVPPAVWLFGTGLLGLVCIARRKTPV